MTKKDRILHGIRKDHGNQVLDFTVQPGQPYELWLLAVIGGEETWYFAGDASDYVNVYGEKPKHKCPKCFEISVYSEPSSHERCSKCGAKNNIFTCGECGDAFCDGCVSPACHECGAVCDVENIHRCYDCGVVFCSVKCLRIHEENDRMHEIVMLDYM